MAIGFALVLLFLLGNALVSFQNMRRVIYNNAEVTRSHQVLAEMQAVLSTMQDAETGQRGYIITGQEKYLEPYTAATAHIGERLQQLRVLVVMPSVKQYLPTLKHQVEERLASLRETIAVRRSAGVDEARGRILSGHGKQEMDAVRATIAEMEGAENTLLVQRAAQSRASAQNALLTLAISSLVSLALLLLVWFIIGRDAAHRLIAAAQLKASSDR
ncbi:MAG: CHASE3 domain-containing protein, partial [Abditibacteriaceae bacterium]